MPDIIDKTVEKLVIPFEKLQGAIVSIGLKVSGKPNALQLIADVNFTDVILNELGGIELVEGIAKATSSSVIAFNPTNSPAVARAMAGLENETYIGQLGDAGAKVKQVLIDSVISKTSPEQLKTALELATKNLSPEKIGSLMNTAIRTTDRRVFSETTKELPDDTLYFYDGPADEKNRPFCAEWVGRTINKKDLEVLRNDQGGPAQIEGGGFNCRHVWVLE